MRVVVFYIECVKLPLHMLTARFRSVNFNDFECAVCHVGTFYLNSWFLISMMIKHVYGCNVNYVLYHTVYDFRIYLNKCTASGNSQRSL